MINLNNNRNYYIQRINKQHRENFDRTYGSSVFFNMDYMGSAEYEFGAVGDSIKFIREHVDEYVLKVGNFKLNILGIEEVIKLFMFVPRGTDEEYIINLFNDIYNYKHRTKEGTHIQDIHEINDKGSLFSTRAWFNLRVNGYASNEIPWFVSADPMIAFYFYKLIIIDTNIDKEQKQIFDSISIGQKVTYPYYDGKKSILERGTVVGFNEDSITVKRFNKKLRFHWRQVIFTK